ncbi:MAG: YwaF family protein [Acholeplasmatales bacterium]|jgi:uncharacterized membrane protein YwaF|nr:YwaF family protein [Acholeplasmatales bacterium]
MFDFLFRSNRDSNIINVSWFSLTHIIILLVYVVLILGLFFIFRNKSHKTKMIVIWVLYGIALANKVWNLIYWYTPLSAAYNHNALYLDPNSEYFNVARWIGGAFPWSLCGINIYLIPLYLLSKKPYLKQLAYTTLMVGAFLAIIIPVGFEYPNPWIFFDFFFNHFVFLVIPLLLVLWKMFKPSFKYFGKTALALIVLLVGAFLISMIFNWTINSQYNPNFVKNPGEGWLFSAIWTVHPGGTIPFNILFKILPVPLLYMILLLPIAFILWFLVLLPFTSKQELKSIPHNLKVWFVSIPSSVKSLFSKNKKDNEVSVKDEDTSTNESLTEDKKEEE